MAKPAGVPPPAWRVPAPPYGVPAPPSRCPVRPPHAYTPRLPPPPPTSLSAYAPRMASPSDLARTAPAVAVRAAGADSPPPPPSSPPPPPSPPPGEAATAAGTPAVGGNTSVTAAASAAAHPAGGASATDDDGRQAGGAATTADDDPGGGGGPGADATVPARRAAPPASTTGTAPSAGSVATPRPDRDATPVVDAAADPLPGGAAAPSPDGAVSPAADRATSPATGGASPPAADTAAAPASHWASPPASDPATDVGPNGAAARVAAPSSPLPLSKEEHSPANDGASLPSSGDAPPPPDRAAPPANPPPLLPPLPDIPYGRPAAGTIKLSSWNINGFKARAKEVLAYVARERPDVLLLQETKLQRPHAPSRHFYLPVYHRAWAFSTAKAGYSGVAIFSLVPPLAVTRGFAATAGGRTDADHPAHGRLLTAEFADVYVVNTYVPNAGEGLVALPYRTGVWDADLAAHLHSLAARGKPVLWGGDLNVASAQVDVAGGIDSRKAAGSPGLTDAERSNFGALLGCTCVADTMDKDAQGGGVPGEGRVSAAATSTPSESNPPSPSGAGGVPAAPAAAGTTPNGGDAAAGIAGRGDAAGAFADAAAPAREVPDLAVGAQPLPSSPSVAAAASTDGPPGGTAVGAAADTPPPRLPAKRRRPAVADSAVVADPPRPTAPHRHCLVDTLRHLYGPVPAVYSFWSMRTAGREVNRGWRIDYWVASGSLLSRLEAAFVRTEVGTSDHCPVGVVLRGVTL